MNDELFTRRAEEENGCMISALGDLKLKCSRCQKTIDGHRSENFTSGFYEVSSGYWNKYAKPGETVICDDCMFRSAAYQRDYYVLPGYEDVRGAL